MAESEKVFVCTYQGREKVTVRIHGEPDMEKFKAATADFLKKVEAIRRKKAKEAAQHQTSAPDRSKLMSN